MFRPVAFFYAWYNLVYNPLGYDCKQAQKAGSRPDLAHFVVQREQDAKEASAMNILSLTSSGLPTDGYRAMPVYQALAEDIRRLGVEHCFGLMSDDTIGLVVALDGLGVPMSAIRHETSAVLAAEGYASASGRLGVAIIGRGPAAANGMHGIVAASRTGTPVLVIMGDEEANAGPNAGGPDYKGYNAHAVMVAAGITAFKAVSAETVRATFAAAVTAAMRGALVTLHVPVSAFNAELMTKSDALSFPAVAPARAAREHAVAAAADVLARSRRPLIVGGLGAQRAGARAALEGLAERIGALLITPIKGKDLFAGNPFNLGLCGSFSHSLARKYVEQADCVLVFGASLNFYTTSKSTFFPDVPIIQVDADRSHIGRYYTADIAIVGDARLVAEQIAERCPPRDAADLPFRADAVREAIAAFDIASDFQPAHTDRTLDPRALAIRLGAMLPQDRSVVYDAGNFLMAACYIPVPGPDRLRFTSDFASMGAGFGTALGVATARPDTVTVLIVGDGGFMMTLSELETVARLALRVVVVVFNDCAYGAELQMCRLNNMPEAASLFADIDLAPLAETLGFTGITLRTLDDLERHRDALAECDGPILIDCKVNADVQAPFIAELVGKH